MASIVNKVKKVLMPGIYHTVATHSAMLTAFWIIMIFFAFGVMWAFVLMLDRIMLLEDAIRVLAAG